MGLSGKVKNSNDQGWGLGLLLVLFLDDDHHEDHHNKKKKQNLISSSFKSTSSTGTPTTSSTSSIFNNKLLISKAQSTISICALIFFFTLLLFTLSTFEPSINNSSSFSSSSSKIHLSNFPRRWLSDKTHNHITKKPSSSSSSTSSVNNVALQGMGTLFRRGNRAMNDLIVAHLNEDTTDDELRLFLRTLHRSSITSRSDVVFIISSSGSFPNFSTIIQEENDSFLKLLQNYRTDNNTDSIVMKKNTKMLNGFDVTQFSKSGNKSSDTLWGRSRTRDDELNEFSFGSVVGFEATELDPEDSLSGFFNDPPPIRLRRWACYPMLLGRLRRNFKHIMLVDVKDVVVLGDSLSQVRNRNAESVYVWMSKTQSHNKKDQSKQPVTADVIMGGMRGVRRLSNAMLNEIVRAAMKHKSKNINSITDSVILSQLVHNESLLKNIDVGVTITESSIPDTSELVNTRRNSSLKNHHNHLVVHRGGNRNLDLKSILLREICSSTLDSSSVYRDC
ncbi:hypothetical protein BVC80_9081g6 [Macleaya cordata]|uniref:DUF7780 domain-containing protein n=1 Tax=Macleaya cordata TaxID=56857 RepID=A0A200PRJ9_MACCD|nr:hypothetical protein BVC80_9081g6 [Macleaya cordata]